MSITTRSETATETAAQPWAYPMVIALLAVSLGVSGAPAPLYGIYEERWSLSPVMTTVIFAAYAFAALAAVLLAGNISDRIGRKKPLAAAVLVMLIGLVVFMTADGVVALIVARTLHGAAVGTAVVVGSAALLDLRPNDGARSGHLTGIIFNVGMAVTILSASILAEFGPNPLVTPYAVVAGVVLVLAVLVALMRETHLERSPGPIRISRPQVPPAISEDFRFSAIGVMASWSVLGIYLSLFAKFAGESTGITHLVFGGAVVASMAIAGALSQALTGHYPARQVAIIGDFGTAAALMLSIVALTSGHASLVVVDALLLGFTFGMAFGGSLRHLGHVVPANHRGEVMSAFYLLAYSAMIGPTIIAGWAATTWGLETAYPWFVSVVAIASVAAGVLGIRSARRAA